MRTIGFVFLTVTVAAVSLLAQQSVAKKDAIEKPEIANSIGMKLVLIPAGKFVMDSAKQKPRVLDTHVHFFDPLRPTAPPWLKDGKPLPRPILPADLKKLSNPHGVVGCIIVEASSVLEDNQWWLDLAAKEPVIVGVIGHLDPALDDFEKNLRREGMEAAAKHPNVFCKVSALVEQTGQKQAPRDVNYYRPVINTLWDLFGEDRLIFGSNWPVSNGGAPYDTVVGIVGDYFAEKGERAAAKFFLGNSQTAYTWGPKQAAEIKNGVSMRLVYIPPGKFLMGSPKSEPGREIQEVQHEVDLTKSFYLGVHEVTVGQFRQLLSDKTTRMPGVGASYVADTDARKARFLICVGPPHRSTLT